ncbi:MAG: Cro/Cl family transcriptional regulator [Rhodospirillaceae bacterium BRH_c57]|nr:MAG: Cro/Cl family transcriptional regulator [Rhodospirillaceae bacterium BRH_c57]
MNPFLHSSTEIDADHPAVAALAARIAAGQESPVDIAAACFAWVRDEISHTADLGHGPVPCRASDVLTAGTGFCFAKSHLLAALLRANGIPAALCYQRLSIDDAGPPFTLHGMVSVLLPGTGWYRCDPRGNRLGGNKPGITTRFTPPVEHLAYTPALPGEADLPDLHAAPLPQVIAALNRNATVADLLKDLPDV